MKRPEICLLIFAVLAILSLTACSPGGSSFNQINCSRGGEVCIHIDTPASFSKGTPVPMDNPITIQIRVNSTKDIPDLYVTLHTDGDVKVDGPQNWEKYVTSTFNQPTLANWNFAIKAGQTLTFNRVLHFPAHEGWFSIGASVDTLGQTLEGRDSFNILVTKDGGYVIRAGTPPPPYTPNVTAAAYGPGTPRPTRVLATFPWEAAPSRGTDTPVPVLKVTPTTSGVVPLVATSTSPGYPPPYP